MARPKVTGRVAINDGHDILTTWAILAMAPRDLNAHSSPSPFTVMIVEDHPDQRALLEIILQKEGYRVLSAENGLEAWEKLQKDDTQLILLDIMLPKMSGLDLLRRIRGDDHLKNICAIFVTARKKESDIVNGLDSGADDYITKPYSFPELLARIRARVRRIVASQRTSVS